MKIQKILLALSAVMLLGTGSVWAAPNGIKGPNPDAPGQFFKKPRTKAPEIDAASATVPLALLTGVVLLMKERTRSRRSSDSE